MTKITESDSIYSHLEKMSTNDLLKNINNEDQTVPKSVKKIIPKIEHLVNSIIPKIKKGGRLFYIGAGTSGRLGVVDASECPPTFGVDDNLIIGLIAGGETAIRKAVEFAEDDPLAGAKDLEKFKLNENDTVIGIAASGTTPYVVGALEYCNKKNILTSCITNNKKTPLSKVSKIPIECIVGPEFITGSTRMKSGTAQKLILNMISTTIMIKIGRIKGNKMIDMQLSNNKLVERGTKMVMKQTGLKYEKAQYLLKKYGSVRNVLNNYNE